MEGRTVQILLIESDKTFTELIKYLLATVYHFHVFIKTAVSLSACRMLLQENQFDAILLDPYLSDSQGVGAVNEIISLSNRTPVIVLTSNDDLEISMKALKLGAQDYLYKSRIDGGILIRSIQYAIERNRLNAALIDSERKYCSLFMEAIDMLLILDEDGQMKDANPACCRKLRVNHDVISQNNIRDFLPNREKRRFQKRWNSFLTEGQAEGILIMMDANTNLFPAEYTARSHFMPGLHMITFRDISARKIQEKELRNYKRTMDRMGKEIQTFYETTNSPILRISQDGVITDCNTATSRIKNLSPENIIGHSIFEYFHFSNHDQKELLSEFIHKVMNSSHPESMEFSIKNGNDEPLSFIFNASAIKTASKKSKSAWFTGQNITELQRYKESLQKQVQGQTKELQGYLNRERELTSVLRESLNKEKELNELKSRFVSMASHEFRTPLTTILASSEILQKYKDKLEEDGIDERIKKIQMSVKDMTNMVDNILIIGKYESGGLQINLEKINIENFCCDIIKEIQSTQPANICLKLKNSTKYLHSDIKYLRHILSNLLSNSVKFTESGSKILLTVSESSGSIIFTVRDRGMGIPKEDIPHIFQPFHRGKNTGGIAGSGLGLSIIKRFVEILNGDIKIFSKLGEGSVFSVKIPNEIAQGVLNK